MKILVADNDKASAERISAMIRTWGWDVEIALSPDEAVDMLSSSACEVVLLDVSNADQTDIETARRLKEARPLVDLVAMNGGHYFNPSFEAELKKHGVLYYTIKPDNDFIMGRVLEHLLIRFEIRKQAEKLQRQASVL